jgi:hypothetical protein
MLKWTKTKYVITDNSKQSFLERYPAASVRIPSKNGGALTVVVSGAQCTGEHTWRSTRHV